MIAAGIGLMILGAYLAGSKTTESIGQFCFYAGLVLMLFGLH
jgi:hypothetical protein